jgi:hypothetical protein
MDVSQDTLDVAIMDLHAPLDLTIDPVKAAEAPERTRIAFLGKAVDIKDIRRRVNSMFCEYNTTQGSMLAREARSPRSDRGPPATSLSRSQAQLASSPNQGQGEHSQRNRAPGRSGGNHRVRLAVWQPWPAPLRSGSRSRSRSSRPPASSHSCEPAGSPCQLVA